MFNVNKKDTRTKEMNENMKLRKNLNGVSMDTST